MAGLYFLIMLTAMSEVQDQFWKPIPKGAVSVLPVFVSLLVVDVEDVVDGLEVGGRREIVSWTSLSRLDRLVPPAMKPMPPAFVTEAARAGVAAPSMGADTIRGWDIQGWACLRALTIVGGVGEMWKGRAFFLVTK